MPAQSQSVSRLLTPELLEQARGLSLTARRIVEGALHGLHRSPFFGFSIEFAEHREYSPGDEPKHLDWKVLARSERYVVKQYEQETNLRAILVVDHSASMAYGSTDIVRRHGKHGSKLEYARVLAAAIGHLLIEQGDSVGLLTATDTITHQVPPRSARSRLLSLCTTLLATEPGERTDLAGALRGLASQLSRRSLVVLISDLFDNQQELLSVMGQLHCRGHEVLVFQVLDRTEYRFEIGNTSRGITVIKDMETGDEFEAEPHLIQEAVQKEIDAFLADLDAGARGYGLHLVRCVTDRPVGDVLSEYIRKRHMSRK
jgi:uncharacterized protein (DUF58 family)